MTRFLLLVLVLLPTLAAATDAQALLERSDQARGGGLPGIVWSIQLTPSEGDRRLEEQRLEVRAVDDASVAETLEPARFRGRQDPPGGGATCGSPRPAWPSPSPFRRASA
jgi:hypothetical protein